MKRVQVDKAEAREENRKRKRFHLLRGGDLGGFEGSEVWLTRNGFRPGRFERQQGSPGGGGSRWIWQFHGRREKLGTWRGERGGAARGQTDPRVTGGK